jgi:hypothetical protein
MTLKTNTLITEHCRFSRLSPKGSSRLFGRSGTVPPIQARGVDSDLSYVAIVDDESLRRSSNVMEPPGPDFIGLTQETKTPQP